MTFHTNLIYYRLDNYSWSFIDIQKKLTLFDNNFILIQYIYYTIQFTSVERVFEYCDLESEAARHTDHRPPKDWPRRGSITFDRLQFSYHRTLPNVLHCITAKINSNEKVCFPSSTKLDQFRGMIFTVIRVFHK